MFIHLSFAVQTPLSSSPLSLQCWFRSLGSEGPSDSRPLMEIGAAGLVWVWSGLIPPAAQLFWSAGFLYLISPRFACNMLHVCQTAQGTPPLCNCA